MAARGLGYPRDSCSPLVCVCVGDTCRQQRRPFVARAEATNGATTVVAAAEEKKEAVAAAPAAAAEDKKVSATER